jgi:hypothetical protein
VDFVSLRGNSVHTPKEKASECLNVMLQFILNITENKMGLQKVYYSVAAHLRKENVFDEAREYKFLLASVTVIFW